MKRTEKLEAGYRVVKYEIVHEKKQENGVENEEQVSDFTLRQLVRFPCLDIFYYAFTSWLVYPTSRLPINMFFRKF